MEICTATILGINACKFVLTGLGIWIFGPLLVIALGVLIWFIIQFFRK